LPPGLRRRRAARVVILCLGLIFGGSAVVLAEHYERPGPRAEPASPTMAVGSASVTLKDGAPQWSAIEVAPASPGAPHWSDPVPARIVFDETRTSRLGAPLAGRVTLVAVERGARVRAGAPLFTVASPNLAELRSERDKARVERDAARLTLARTQALVEGQALPGKELVAARQQVAEAELAVRVAEQKLGTLHVTATGDSSFTVTAPRDGVVVEKNLAVGQEVDTSTASLLAISDLSVVWVVADLFEADLGTLRAGAQASIVAGDETITGVVDQVSAMVDPERHTIPVRVKLDNRDGALRPNAHVQLRFLDPAPAKVELPASAVMSDGATSYVYVREGHELRRLAISVGAAHAGKVAVLDGLAPGQAVVTRGAILLDNQVQLDH
jgi:RND family efflux transporter MFP subunit